MNHKLKQKLFVSRVTKKVDSTKSGQDFIDALEQMVSWAIWKLPITDPVQC